MTLPEPWSPHLAITNAEWIIQHLVTFREFLCNPSLISLSSLVISASTNNNSLKLLNVLMNAIRALTGGGIQLILFLVIIFVFIQLFWWWKIWIRIFWRIIQMRGILHEQASYQVIYSFYIYLSYELNFTAFSEFVCLCAHCGEPFKTL